MPAAKSSITFVNASEFEASVYVIDDGGKETFVIDLAPGKSSSQNTTKGQVWIVKDKETGTQVGTVTGKSGKQTYKIKFGRGRGEPTPSGTGG
jgi:hypothetical protein